MILHGSLPTSAASLAQIDIRTLRPVPNEIFFFQQAGLDLRCCSVWPRNTYLSWKGIWIYWAANRIEIEFQFHGTYTHALEGWLYMVTQRLESQWTAGMLGEKLDTVARTERMWFLPFVKFGRTTTQHQTTHYSTMPLMSTRCDGGYVGGYISSLATSSSE